MVSFTALPIGEYAAVTLLLFFGLKSIKDAWDLPAVDSKGENKDGSELGEFTEAEELVKEKVRNTIFLGYCDCIFFNSPMENLISHFFSVFC